MALLRPRGVPQWTAVFGTSAGQALAAHAQTHTHTELARCARSAPCAACGEQLPTRLASSAMHTPSVPCLIRDAHRLCLASSAMHTPSVPCLIRDAHCLCLASSAMHTVCALPHPQCTLSVPCLIRDAHRLCLASSAMHTVCALPHPRCTLSAPCLIRDAHCLCSQHKGLEFSVVVVVVEMEVVPTACALVWPAPLTGRPGG